MSSDDLSQLQECAFEGVRFPIESAQTDGGNDVVEHMAYRRRGADVEFTGQKPYKGSLVVALFNTPALVAQYGMRLFPDLRFELLRLFERQRHGRLAHPTFGTFDAAITDWSEPLAAQERNGARWTIRWTEHNGGASLLIGPDGALPSNGAAAAEATAAEADAEGAGVAGYKPLAPTVGAQLAYLETDARSFSQVDGAFRAMLAAVKANLALPDMAGTASSPATLALLTLRATLTSLRAQYAPSANALRYYTTPVTMALWEVAQAVYGDASKARLLLAANAVSDPLQIPAGRVLTVLPT